MRRERLLLCISFLCLPFICMGEEKWPAPVKAGERGTITIPSSCAQSDAEQLKLRLHAIENPPAYDVSKEVFEVIVPKNYRASEPHGLFIWIGAGNAPSISKDWEKVLADKKIIFVGARNSGNPRNIFDRMRMAIDANVHLRTLYPVDGRRVYVSGFSGGSRVASMLGVCYAEMFSGTICFMGVNFYTDVTGEDGKTYGLNFIPDDQVVELAKKFCRYALFTAEKDFNRSNTRAAFEQGFQKEAFANVKLFEVLGIGHQAPSGDWLAKALDYLDEGKGAKK